MKNDPAVPIPDHVEIDTPSDTPVADGVLAEVEDHDREQQFRNTELQDRLSAMKHEMDRMKESVTLLSAGARALVVEAPSLAQEELRYRVRTNPLPYMVYAAGAAFVFGRYLQR
ncbi:hypothetical protein [Phyllobacterium sp. SB3]|uniref:hypothetical protein n=1 Tax=Phyllobacterium sp. SB3 TaxID=3156073 RepID=UPI0032AF4623